MTHEQWIKLSPEEQRIKVAELCGWQEVRYGCDSGSYRGVVGTRPGWPIGKNYMEELRKRPSGDFLWAHNAYNQMTPDYLNDLNAMHEAESIIGVGQISRYMRLLADRDKITDSDIKRDDWAAVHATAAQRAEAFVLTMERVSL